MKYFAAFALLASALLSTSTTAFTPSQASRSPLRPRSFISWDFFEDESYNKCSAYDEYDCGQNSDSCRWSKGDKECFSKFAPSLMNESIPSSRKLLKLQQNIHILGEEDLPGCQRLNGMTQCAHSTNNMKHRPKSEYKPRPVSTPTPKPSLKPDNQAVTPDVVSLGASILEEMNVIAVQTGVCRYVGGSLQCRG